MASDATQHSNDSDESPTRTFRVLVVDDEVAAETAREIVDTVGQDPNVTLEVLTEESFEAARERLLTEEFDVVILDVMRQRKAGESQDSEDPDAGTTALDVVKRTKFVPVIFYTARHMEVNDRKAPPFVQVVSKDDIDLLPDAVRSAMKSGIQLVIRELRHFVDVEIRDFLWGQVTEHPEAYDLPPDVNASVLATRIAEGIPGKVPALVRALASANAPAQSDNSLGSSEAGEGQVGGVGNVGQGDVRPSDAAARYLLPPVDGLQPGSILRDQPMSVALPGQEPHHDPDRLGSSWWVVLTPACDFAQKKVQLVLLARAYPLEEFELYIAYRAKDSGSTRGKLRSALSGSTERYVFLPAFVDVTNLVVDFQHVETVTIEHATRLQHIADLTSPFGEALLNNHARYRGRIGTPDIPKAILDQIVPG